MKKNQKNKLRLIILSALFSAMIFALTFSVKVPMPGGGYIHLGDAMIYLSACILPTPYALLGAGIGGAMSDFASGYAIYIIPTLLIKALISLPFTSKSSKIMNTRNGVACIFSGIITVIGYYFTKVVMLSMTSSGSFADVISGIFKTQNWVGAFVNIPENVIQAVGSAVLFIILALAMDKIKIKEKLSRLML